MSDDSSSGAADEPAWMVEKRARIRARVRAQLAAARARPKSDSTPQQRVQELLARMMANASDEGKERARRQMDAAHDVDWADLRAKIGLPPRADRGAAATAGSFPAVEGEATLERMEQNTSPQPSMADALARVGVVVGEEGKARARRRLAEADALAGSDPAGTEAFRARLRQGSAAA